MTLFGFGFKELGGWPRKKLQLQNSPLTLNVSLNSHGYKPTAYCDDKAAWDILSLLAKWFRTQLKLRLADSPYYSIMVDETTDKSTTSQLIIYVKYLKHNSEGDLEVVIEYLDLISLDGGTALDITVVSYVNNANNRLLFTNLFEHSAFL